MDEMHVVTNFAKSVASKVFEIAIKKSLGYSTKIRVDDIAVTNTNEKTHIHLDVEIDMDHSELLKILKGIGLS